MTGRIKLLKDGVPVSSDNEPPLGYEYDSISEFDSSCGTFGLDAFQLPNDQCPDKFVCVAEDASPKFKEFSTCIDAMNCFMLAGMTTKGTAQSPTALFIHQMIPHHQNAVNMAKVLLHDGDVQCDDLTNEDDPKCVMEAVLRDIVNTQNHQIQQMLSILKGLNYSKTDDCSVLVAPEREIAVDQETSKPTNNSPKSAGIIGVDRVAALTCALMMFVALFA
jgi:Domain of unknown function (DUF305)